jgi:hypothetical protein
MQLFLGLKDFVQLQKMVCMCATFALATDNRFEVGVSRHNEVVSTQIANAQVAEVFLRELRRRHQSRRQAIVDQLPAVRGLGGTNIYPL